MQNAKFIVTDSGGIQEESTVLSVPCLTARENTERPVTITHGTNTLVGTNKKKIITEAKKILAGRYKKGKQPKYWDGKSSQRIVAKLKELYKKGKLVRK
jgi:UDP-N-acetylglucosamine 2-epimerase (non-hydrolysing)